MKELLFNNIIEKEALENVLALNQIKKCDKEIEKYTNEINEQNEEMIRILKEENIEENYIERISKYKSLLSNLDKDNGRISELEGIINENENRINEFQERINGIELKLEELKREIFETNDPSRVIECQNEIENNNVRLNDLNEILNSLISDNTPLLIEKEYLLAKNNDYDFNVPNYNKEEIVAEIEKATLAFNSEVEKLELPVRENIEFCQKKIKNREIEISKLLDRKNNVIENYPNSIDFDVEGAYVNLGNLLYEIDSNLGFEDYSECDCDTECNCDCSECECEENNCEIEYEQSVSEEVVEESEIEEEKDIKDEMSNLEELPEERNEQFEEKTEISEEVLEETPEEKDEVEEINQEDIGSVSYILSEGESMMNIAEKVYPSKDNWEAIYYFNKDAIDNFLVSNGLSNDFDTIKELANDTSLFAGIQLEIPTDYNYKI